MATSGKPLDERARVNIMRLRTAGVSMREIARRELVSLPTVQKILKTGVDKFHASRVK